MHHLDICVPYINHGYLLRNQSFTDFEAAVCSLLDATVMLAPSDLRFAVVDPCRRIIQVNMPRLSLAKSIELEGLDLVFNESLHSGHGFPVLERPVLSRCRAILSSWVHRSPRLLLLRVGFDNKSDSKLIVLRSNSLQELNVEAKIPSYTDNVNIVAPALKQLTMSFGGHYYNMLVSVDAPNLDKVSWKCTYSTAHVGIGGDPRAGTAFSHPCLIPVSSDSCMFCNTPATPWPGPVTPGSFLGSLD
jgi:hypothetical protein